MATGGFGVEFYIGNKQLSLTPTYTEAAKVEDISPIGGESIMDDITAHDSPGGYAEKIATGLYRLSDVEISLIHDLSQATQKNAAGGLLYNWINRILTAYKISLPDGMDWEFDAYVSKYEVSAVKDKAMRSKITLTITGQPVIS